MIYSDFGKTGVKVSRLGLGTAEIGFAYGLGERSVPEESEAISLLRSAAESGINFFDTAHYYGLSEERIGKSGILKNPNVMVETKCAQFLEKGEILSREEMEKRISAEVHESLKKLSVERLPILMLHGPSAEQIKKGELILILKDLKEKGKIRFTGVSTRGEEAPLAAIESGFFDCIQIAYSILDQRMNKVIDKAAERGVAVVNRSVLLKGSLTPLLSRLPAGLEPLKSNSLKAEKVAKKAGIDLPTLALRFALSHPRISTSLIGTARIENLKRSVQALEMGTLPADIIEELKGLAIYDPNQVDPARWPK